MEIIFWVKWLSLTYLMKSRLENLMVFNKIENVLLKLTLWFGSFKSYMSLPASRTWLILSKGASMVTKDLHVHVFHVVSNKPYTLKKLNLLTINKMLSESF